MYNEDFKKQYMRDDSSNKNFDKLMPRLFETVAPYEEEYGKDLCNFNIEEIRNYYVGLSTSSVMRCMNIRSQFIKYSVYCEERNLVKDHQIHWEEADKHFIIKCVNYGKRREELVTRTELENEISNLNNARDKFIALAIFEGICGNKYIDFRDLTTRDFKAKNGKYLVKLPNNRELDVSSRLFSYAEESRDCYVLYSDGFPNGRKVFDENDKRIIKMSKTATTDFKYEGVAYLHKISNILSAIKKKTEKAYFTQSALVNSGRLYYIYKHTEHSQDVTNFVSTNRQYLEYRFGRIQSIEDVVAQYNALYGGGNEGNE